MNQSNSQKSQSQASDPEAVRRRIHLMKLDFPQLDQPYLAKRLRRSQTAISFALGGQRPQLLGRIVRHLDWLTERRAKKLAEIGQKAA